jgi:N-dimethylarginine dimethylaminohydrolase
MTGEKPENNFKVNPMRHTAHSDIGKIKSLFIKNAKQAFVSESHLEQHWESLNYLGKPRFDQALQEYGVFQSILESVGAKIYFLPEDPGVNMDSIYCRDASISTDQGMILCNMGKAARVNEPGAQKISFDTQGVPVLGIIRAPGTVEGGDVAWLDEHTLAVGHTYRTNEEGIRQLTEFLKPLGVQVITVPLPHYKGPSDVFHLMSILSPVDKDLAVVYSPLMPIGFRNLLLERGFQLVEVPEEEFDSMGCNVLALAPRICLMVDGNPQTKKALEDAGCQVIVYVGEEISVKGGGGPTCLTRPVDRYI